MLTVQLDVVIACAAMRGEDSAPGRHARDVQCRLRCRIRVDGNGEELRLLQLCGRVAALHVPVGPLQQRYRRHILPQTERSPGGDVVPLRFSRLKQCPSAHQCLLALCMQGA